ncbi:MAG: hypothetical protein ABEI07_01110, partial [Candidatus Nanohaloarchaea archaeon]
RVLEIVDKDRVSTLTEYNKLHNLEPDHVEFKYFPRQNPRYHLYLEPGDEASRQMVENGIIEDEMTGVTTFDDIKDVREALV